MIHSRVNPHNDDDDDDQDDDRHDHRFPTSTRALQTALSSIISTPYLFNTPDTLIDRLISSPRPRNLPPQASIFPLQ